MLFDEKEFGPSCWTHDLTKLVKAADLLNELNGLLATNLGFSGFWGTVTDWKETSRYVQTGEVKAKALYKALTHKKHGVMRWIRGHW